MSGNWRLGLAAALLGPAVQAAGPVQVLPRAPIPAPVDHAFVGTIELAVDATDIAHKLITVHERIPVQQAGPLTLLYPRFEAASHGPSLSVASLAGLTVRADGRPLGWRRDPVEPHAFQLVPPAGARWIEVEFELVTGAALLSPAMVMLPWPRLLLYPASWYARNLTVAASARLPDGLKPVTALDTIRAPDGTVRFAPVTLETLLDSPVYAARYAKRERLTASPASPVWFDLLGAAASDTVLPSARLAELRKLIEQAQIVFGAAPFRQFDIIVHATGGGGTGGIEHRASSEIAIDPTFFQDWAARLNDRDIFAHEFVHAWNGLYRVPADLWAPTPNEPQGGSLLWVYEGQTEFWGRVLAARAGQRSAQETLDKLALDAASVANRPGRRWRSLSDDVTYPSFMLGQSVPWRDWQRRKDYYQEGVLLWLAVDAKLRERSGGRRGIDDFAHGFFGDAQPDGPARTYDFAQLCAALNATAPFDWTGYLQTWIDAHDELDPTVGLAGHGWRLTFTGTPTETDRQNADGATDLTYSIGLSVGDDGEVQSVAWDGPAFRAGLAPRSKLVLVNGAPFSTSAFVAAVRDAKRAPVTVTYEQDGQRLTRTLGYRGTLRYPRLERIPGRPDTLTPLLAPR